MPDERRKLIGLLNRHRGLMVLLAIGVALLLLAVAVPQTWATPDQDRLRQSIPNVVPDKIECYRACDEPIYVYGSAFFTGTDYYTGSGMLYLTSDVEWISGTTTVDGTGDPVVFNSVPVTIVNGEFEMVLIWDPPPDLAAGGYDLFVDINGNMILDNGDGINNSKPPYVQPQPWGGAGLCVEPCEVGGATLSRRQYWLVPGAAAVVALVLGGAMAGLALRHRRG